MPDQPHPYVPPGPLESAPRGDFNPREVRGEAFAAVLDGIPTGAYDHRMIAWLTDLDDPTCQAFASLMWRCRLAAPPGSVTEWALAYTHRPSIPGQPARRVVQPYPSEAEARAAVAQVLRLTPEDEPALARREVGPWRLADEPATGEARGDA